MMRIVLPWPDRRLSPNARIHWRAKAPVTAKARKDAVYLTYDAMPMGAREVRQHFAGEGPISYQVTFYPPDKRHRDDDSMIAMLKAARDGIADALGVNDRRFKPHYFFEEPSKPGRVEVVISPIKSTTCGSNGDSIYLRKTTDSAAQKSGRNSVCTAEPALTKNAR